MKLLPRRNQPAESTADALVDDVPVSGAPDKKNRPTPKRRDKAPVRGPVTAPKTRKEAYARQREQGKVAKSARGKQVAAMTPAERREAMRAGDPALLPRRDQGPVKQLARNYVDSRRMIANYLLPAFAVMIVLSFLPALRVLPIVLIVAIFLESYLVGRRVRTLAIEREGKDAVREGTFTLGWYAVSRAFMFRRWRIPKPQVALGEQI